MPVQTHSSTAVFRVARRGMARTLAAVLGTVVGPPHCGVSRRTVAAHALILCAAAGTQFREDVGYVGRDRLRCQHQLLRDLPVGEPGRHKLGDLVFALAQRMPRLGLAVEDRTIG